MSIKSLVRTIPHHPKPGIMFRDITTLLKDPIGFRITIEALVDRYANQNIQKVVGIESRGFIVGAPLAFAIGAGFVPIRKRANYPPRPSVTTTNWSMVPTESRSTLTPLSAVNGSC